MKAPSVSRVGLVARVLEERVDRSRDLGGTRGVLDLHREELRPAHAPEALAQVLEVEEHDVRVGAEWALWALNRAPGQTVLGIAHLELRWAVALSGVAVALGLGFAAGFVPALGAYRARVTEMLRNP